MSWWQMCSNSVRLSSEYVVKSHTVSSTFARVSMPAVTLLKPMTIYPGTTASVTSKMSSLLLWKCIKHWMFLFTFTRMMLECEETRMREDWGKVLYKLCSLCEDGWTTKSLNCNQTTTCLCQPISSHFLMKKMEQPQQAIIYKFV